MFVMHALSRPRLTSENRPQGTGKPGRRVPGAGPGAHPVAGEGQRGGWGRRRAGVCRALGLGQAGTLALTPAGEESTLQTGVPSPPRRRRRQGPGRGRAQQDAPELRAE